MKTKFFQKIQDATLLACTIAAALFAIFTIFTLLTLVVDVRAIGPFGSKVGFSKLNLNAWQAMGRSETWYKVSEIMGLLTILAAVAFVGLGVWQLIRRKSLRKIDPAIWLLGLLYVCLAGTYAVFELIIVNYRPILVEGVLEASYPSSHTMLVCGVMGSAIVAVWHIFASKIVRISATAVASVVTVLTLVGRMLSGVHWLTDIIGGVLIAAALVAAYLTAVMAARDLRKAEESKTDTPESVESVNPF